MGLPDAALELENRSLGPSGEPTLWAALEILRDAWRAGDRDREIALHLMFLAWFVQLEPSHLTGAPAGVPLDEPPSFEDVHDFCLVSTSNDAEMLYVVGLMAQLCPWCLGDTWIWQRRSEEYRKLYRELAPGGIPVSVFVGRGAYGDYFAGHAALVGGY